MKNINEKEINKRQKVFNRAKRNLKKSFVGIDTVIDRIFNNIEVWYLMPEFLNRPTVVNLWGLTGTGKTDLVRRLVSELEMADKFVDIQMSTSNDDRNELKLSYHINSVGVEHDEQGILLLDEIQRFRSIDENGMMINNGSYQDIWMMLSDGMLSDNRSYTKDLITLLISIQSDKAYKGQKRKKERRLSNKNADTDSDPSDVPSDEDEYAISRFDEWKHTDFKERTRISSSIFEISVMSDDDKINIVENLLRNRHKKEEKKFTKLLIFICGNLDKAYDMSFDISQNSIDADVFHQHSKTINISRIKSCLLSQFKPEQIARFGNNHIIYPSLRKKDFQKLIDIHIDRAVLNAKTLFDVDISYDSNVKECIYRNGVYPTQGVRPLFSTLNSIIDNTLSHFLMIMYKNGQDKVKFHIDEKSQSVFCLINGKKYNRPIDLDIDSIKTNMNKNTSSVICVHECGHGLVYGLLFGIAPSQIVCDAIQDDHTGFSGRHKSLQSTRMMLDDICVYLSGLAAEELVYGKNLRTAGGSGDIYLATQIAGRMVRQVALGKNNTSHITISSDEINVLNTDVSETNEEIEQIISDQLERAKEILKENEKAFKTLINLVKEKKSISDVEYVEEMSKYIPGIRIEKSDFTVTEEYSSKLDHYLSDR